MEDAQTMGKMDPETEFLRSKRQTGNEWELFKENVRPLKRGRNVNILNGALKAHTDNHLKKSLLQSRRKLIEAIDEYKGDDPLQPWLECIKWVQEAFPPGGDYSGLVVIYEQCVRKFWHSDRYKDDIRYLKVWLEYADNCVDAEVIYSFLQANEIGTLHSVYYITYALHMEAKSKMKYANDIFNLGVSRNAQPIDKLKEAYRKFLARSMRRPNATEEDAVEKCLSSRSFGTVLSRKENGVQTVDNFDRAKKNLKPNRASLDIYKDSDTYLDHQGDISKTDLNSWKTLGVRAERNKENNDVPSKWTSYKIPQRPGSRTVEATSSTHIDVFVDEECTEVHRQKDEEGKPSVMLLGLVDGHEYNKRETELLRENPLRNFHPTALPR